MSTRDVYVYAHLRGDWVPSGLLRMLLEDQRVVSSTFRYGRRYLERADAFPVDAHALPLRDEVFRTEERFDLFSGIQDALPDAWGRAVMERRAERPLREDEILMASPDTRVGALAFGSGLDGPKREVPWRPELERLDDADLESVIEAYADYDDDRPERSDEALRRLVLPGSSVGGARPKAVVVRDDRMWIAKFSRTGDPFDYPRAELATMQLARRCGISVPAVDHRVVGDRSAFLVERFDRSGSTRIHINSMLTVLGETELSFFHSSYMDMADAFVAHVRDHDAARRELFRRMVFNGLSSNDDDHLRNHALIWAPERGFHLSPAYDLVANPAAASPPRLSIGCGLDESGRVTRTFTLDGALRAASRFGLAVEEARRIVNEVQNGLRGWEDVFASTGMRRRSIDSFALAFDGIGR
jgi:serine/threonine-protein kinase HipA